MSHVDEGQIHAYLDGQSEYADRSARERLESHVAACRECAALLEEARAIHSRATGVLGDSEPSAVDLPAFEEILQRASERTSRSASVRKLHRTRTLAWAASIVVAVAVGWYARISLTSPTQTTEGQLEANEPALGFAEEQAAEAEVTTEEQAAADPQLAATSPDRDALASTAARSRAEQAAGAGVEAEEQAVDSRLAQGRAAAPAAQRQAAADELARVAERRLVDSTRLQEVAEQVRARGAREPEVAGGVFAQVSGLANAPGWTEVSRPQAEQRLGRQILVVEGLEVTSISVTSDAPDVIVRVVQQLPSGDSLEIVQRPSGELDRLSDVAAAERRDAPLEKKAATDESGVSSVVTTRGNLLIEMRGKLPSDSLEVLLSRLREAARSN
jgi:hypothetical protein